MSHVRRYGNILKNFHAAHKGKNFCVGAGRGVGPGTLAKDSASSWMQGLIKGHVARAGAECKRHRRWFECTHERKCKTEWDAVFMLGAT